MDAFARYHVAELYRVQRLVGSAEDAEDIMSTAYLRVVARNPQLPPGRSHSWFRTVVDSCIADWRRHRRYQKRGGGVEDVRIDDMPGWDEMIVDRGADADSVVLHREAERELLRVLEAACLTEVQKQLLHLTQVCGLKVAAAARQMALPYRQARYQHKKALARLREIAVRLDEPL